MENQNIENEDLEKNYKMAAPIINILFVGALLGGCTALQELGLTPDGSGTSGPLTETEQELGLKKTHHAVIAEAGEHFIPEDELQTLENLEGYTYANKGGVDGFINIEDVVVEQYVNNTTSQTSYPTPGTPISKLNVKEKVLCKRL